MTRAEAEAAIIAGEYGDVLDAVERGERAERRLADLTGVEQRDPRKCPDRNDLTEYSACRLYEGEEGRAACCIGVQHCYWRTGKERPPDEDWKARAEKAEKIVGDAREWWEVHFGAGEWICFTEKDKKRRDEIFRMPLKHVLWQGIGAEHPTDGKEGKC